MSFTTHQVELLEHAHDSGERLTCLPSSNTGRPVLVVFLITSNPDCPRVLEMVRCFTLRTKSGVRVMVLAGAYAGKTKDETNCILVPMDGGVSSEAKRHGAIGYSLGNE